MTEDQLNDKDLFERVHKAILERVETEAVNYNESQSDFYLIHVDEFSIVVRVSVTISNYVYEQDTNSADYDIEIFCTGIEKTNYEPLDEYLTKHIYLETLWQQ